MTIVAKKLYDKIFNKLPNEYEKLNNRTKV